MNTDTSIRSPIWLTERDVGQCVSLNEAIDALDEGLRLEAQNEAANVDKAFGTWNSGSSMHALGSMMPLRGYVGFKTWANTPNGATALFSLFDAHNGALLAAMEAGLLGKLRTSGITGLATRALADPAADDMALVGTGVQAFMQVAAIAATRRIGRLRVFSPTPEKRARFVARARDMFAFPIEDCVTLEQSVEDAPIVTLITRSREPFLDAGMLAAGTHLNAAGAILPANAEFHLNVFDRAGLIVVDSLPNARKASRELREHFGTGEDGWQGVKTLGEILVSGRARRAETDLTVFKPMGMGLSDLSVAVAVYERASELGMGATLPASALSEARWFAQT